MKVICQNCNAAYVINDTAIPPKGARAQCPRCKHLQQVKKPDAEAAPPPLPTPGGAPPPLPKPASASVPPPIPKPTAAPAPPPVAAPTEAPQYEDPFADLNLSGPQPSVPAPAPAPAPMPAPTKPAPSPVASPMASRGAPAAVAGDPFAALDLAASRPPSSPPMSASRPNANAATSAPPLASATHSDPFADLDLGAPPPPRNAPTQPARPGPTSSSMAPTPSVAMPAVNGQSNKSQARPPSLDPFAELDLGGPPPAANPLSSANKAGAAAASRAPVAQSAVAVPRQRPDSDPFANLDLGTPTALPSQAPTKAPQPATSNRPPPADAGPAPLGKCRVCGKLIFDPFDAALGTCESCRAKEQNAASDAPNPATTLPPPNPGTTQPPVGPNGAETKSSKSKQPKSAEPVEKSEVTKPKQPIPRPKVIDNPTRQDDTPSRSTPVALIVVLVLLAGAAAVWFTKPAVLFGKPKVVGPTVPPKLTALATRWELGFPQLSGTVDEHLKAARAHMAEDRVGDYSTAENEYKQAVLLDLKGKNHAQLAEAVAGVVESYVLGPGEFRDKAMETEIQDVMNGAMDLAPNSDKVQRARVYLLLRGGPAHLNEAREAAKAAYDAAPLDGKAEALLAQGCAYLDSAQVAYEYLDKALQADPKLRRAYYYRGLAAERVGHYAAAVKDFQKRLDLDPDARRSLVEIAKIYVSVGEVAQAKKVLAQVLQKEPGAPDAILAQATIAYQLDHSPQQAENLLDALLNGDSKPKDPIAVAALVHGAAITREKGDLAKASSRLEQALKIDPDYAPAYFQQVLVALAAGKPTDADAPLAKLGQIAPEGFRLDALQGRVSFAQGKTSEGVAHFRTALNKQPQDLRAALLGAALSSKAERGNDAYALMAKAMEIDPTQETRHRGVTDYYESEKSELTAAAGGFEKEDNSLAQPLAYAGVLRYHRGDFSSAESHFNEALKLEPASVPALTYLAQLALDRKKPPKAEELARRAIDAERLSTLGKFLLAESLELQNNTEEARKLYAETLGQAPYFTGAMLHQGQLLTKANRTEDGTQMLLKVFFADPDDTEARAALFKQGY